MPTYACCLSVKQRIPIRPSKFAILSVKEPFRTDWKERVREKIRKVDQVIVICGEHTDTASAVNAEIPRGMKRSRFFC